jgi:outer membrane receptor for ferrienterochelin and colicins
MGTGFFAATPLTEETEAAGLTHLKVQKSLEAERGLSASFNITRTDGPFSSTATVFASRIKDPIHVDPAPAYVLRNLTDPTRNVGVEPLSTFRKEPFAVTATYTYVHARQMVDGFAQDSADAP